MAAAFAAAITLAWVLSARPHSVQVTDTVPVGADAMPTIVAGTVSPVGTASPVGASSPRPSGSATDLVVDVAGKVRHPGLVHLPTGSRVYDALRAAGGALPGVDTVSLNLAARLSDGQQIVVGLPGVGAAAGAASGGAGVGASGGPVDLNTATLEQLQALSGVGPVLAQHILDWRIAHGAFASVEQLREVPGIGPAKFAAMRDQARV